MTRLLSVLVTALLAWCGVMQPVQASVPTPAAAVATYAYDACHHAAVPMCTTTERGPPAEPYRDIANPAVGHRPDGALARSARTATSIAYTYDALAPLAQAARDAGTTHKQVQDERAALSALGESRVAAETAAGVGARDAAIEATTEGQRFVRIGAGPRNLKWTFEHPGGTAPGTYAVPEDYFNSISHDPAYLKDVFDLPDTSLPQVYRLLEPPAGTPIQYGTVPGGEFGGVGGAPEVFFPKGY